MPSPTRSSGSDTRPRRRGGGGALGVVNKILSEPLKLKVVNVIGGGDEWATIELEANATCKNGQPRTLPLYLV